MLSWADGRTRASSSAATGPFTTATVVDLPGSMSTVSAADHDTSMSRDLVTVEADPRG